MHRRWKPPKVAPLALCALTKAQLADLVWEFAATSPDCESCDDGEAVWRVIYRRLGRINGAAVARRSGGPDAD